MKRSEPQNLFELESLEPRILLSADPLLGAVHAGAPDDLDPLLENDPGAVQVAAWRLP